MAELGHAAGAGFFRNWALSWRVSKVEMQARMPDVLSAAVAAAATSPSWKWESSNWAMRWATS